MCNIIGLNFSGWTPSMAGIEMADYRRVVLQIYEPHLHHYVLDDQHLASNRKRRARWAGACANDFLYLVVRESLPKHRGMAG